MLVDVMAHRHVEDPKFRDELVTDDFEAELAAFEAEQIASLEENLDEWETVIDEKYEG